MCHPCPTYEPASVQEQMFRLTKCTPLLLNITIHVRRARLSAICLEGPSGRVSSMPHCCDASVARIFCWLLRYDKNLLQSDAIDEFSFTMFFESMFTVHCPCNPHPPYSNSGCFEYFSSIYPSASNVFCSIFQSSYLLWGLVVLVAPIHRQNERHFVT